MKRILLFLTIAVVLVVNVQAAPPVIDGLVMHLDASAISATDGDTITTWSDQSGTGNNASLTSFLFI